jgi:hypothetical protein
MSGHQVYSAFLSCVHLLHAVELIWRSEFGMVRAPLLKEIISRGLFQTITDYHLHTDLQTAHLMQPDVAGFDALIEIVQSTKYLPKVLSMITNHYFYDWSTASAVYLSLLVRVVEPNLDLNESKWSTLVNEWRRICMSDQETLDSGSDRLKKLLSAAWPSVTSRISLQ